MKCAECGAEFIDGKTCETQYHECLVKEFNDSGYGTVHHLTVATYMLQHSSKLSLQGWRETQRLLRDFVIVNKRPAEVRKQNKKIVDSGKREWKITSRDGTAKISKNQWTKTILDVGLENVEAYRADVTSWAQATLKDSDEIVHI